VNSRVVQLESLLQLIPSFGKVAHEIERCPKGEVAFDEQGRISRPFTQREQLLRKVHR